MKRILTDREISVARDLRHINKMRVNKIAMLFGVSPYVIEWATNDAFKARKLAYNKGYYAGKKARLKKQ